VEEIAESQPQDAQQSMKRILLFLIILPLLACSNPKENESEAAKRCQAINIAQWHYHNKYDAFASISQLVKTGLLPDKYPTTGKTKFELDGYIFEFEYDKDSFKLDATPKEYGSTGIASFYVSSNTLKVHTADKKGMEAGPGDPTL
jgi:hypothetical protein